MDPWIPVWLMREPEEMIFAPSVKEIYFHMVHISPARKCKSIANYSRAIHIHALEEKIHRRNPDPSKQNRNKKLNCITAIDSSDDE